MNPVSSSPWSPTLLLQRNYHTYGIRSTDYAWEELRAEESSYHYHRKDGQNPPTRNNLLNKAPRNNIKEDGVIKLGQRGEVLNFHIPLHFS
jgi:hypothetical protein